MMPQMQGYGPMGAMPYMPGAYSMPMMPYMMPVMVCYIPMMPYGIPAPTMPYAMQNGSAFPAMANLMGGQQNGFGSMNPQIMQQLAEFSAHHKNADLSGQIIFDEEGKEVFMFGKHKGQRVEDVFRKEPPYYDWIMKNDFPLYTKKVVTAIRLRMGGKKVKH